MSGVPGGPAPAPGTARAVTPGLPADDDALVAAVVGAVVAGDGERVLALLTAQPERDRKRLSERLRVQARAALPILSRDRPEDVNWALELVTLCTGSPAEYHPSALGHALRRTDEAADGALALAARAAASRPPSWRTRMLRGLLSLGPDGVAWELTSRLAEAGAVEPSPDGAHLPGLWVAHTPTTLATAVARRPVVREEAWASLRVDATSTLYCHLAASQQDLAAWFAAFFRVLDVDRPGNRARLVDECLVRLHAVRTVPQARLFVETLGHLRLADDEVAARQDRYLALLAAPCPSGVKVAHEALRRLLAAGVLDGAGLVEASPDALARPEKGLVKAHLRLLADAVKGKAADPAAVADVLAAALDPERPDLATATAVALRRCAAAIDGPGRAGVGAVVASRVPLPWPDLLTALGPELAPRPVPAARAPGSDDAATPHGDGAAPAVRTPDPPAPVDLPEPGALAVPADADETCDLVAALLEELDDPVATELALAGMVRWRDVRPVAARAVAHRAVQQIDTWGPYPHSLGSAFLAVVLRWLDPALLRHERFRPPPGGLVLQGWVTRTEDVPRGATARHVVRVTTGTAPVVTGCGWELVDPVPLPAVLQQARLLEVQRLLGGRRGVLLATPSRSDGTLDAATLEGRLEALATQPARPRRWPFPRRGPAADAATPHDVALAVLRLRPEDRPALAARPGEEAPTGLAALAALGAPEAWRRVVEPVGGGLGTYGLVPRPAAVWRGPDLAGRLDAPLLGWCDTGTVAPYWDRGAAYGDRDRSTGAALSGAALSLPHEPDLLAAHLQPVLSFWLEKPQAPLGGVTRALGATTAPLGGPAAAALVWLAAAKDVTVRTAAAEALAAAAQRGTLTGATVGRGLVDVLGPDAGPFAGARPKLTRVASTLADTARLGPAADRLVLDALVVMLPVLHDLRGAAELLDVAVGCAERRGVPVPLPPGLAALAAASSSTRTAAAARRLAAVGTR